jgi:SOS-response transcriptional repressor LexA
MNISEIQQKILDSFRQAIVSGENISMRDIGGEFDLAPNTILYHIRRLEKKGLLIRDGNGKVIRVNSPDDSQAVAFLPLLANASCGSPLDQIVDENLARMIPVPLFLLGRNKKKSLYLIKAVGDSMSPKIEDGDLVIFEKNPAPEVGKVIVARTNEGFTIKVFRKTRDQYLLDPLNTKYQPLVFDKTKNEGLNIDGVAVGVFKPQENLGGGD